jgi:UDP-N-acetyl-D-galactosamine dehydrogenase
VKDMVKELLEYGVDVSISEPYATEEDTIDECGFGLAKYEDLPKADAAILAVGHKPYLDLGLSGIQILFRNNRSVFMDVKYQFSRSESEDSGLTYWSL